MSVEPVPDVELVATRLVGDDAAVIDEVHREPVEYDAFLAGRSVVRLRGRATLRDQSVAWSFIEKATDGPATAPAYLYGNAIREFTAYRSGLLDDLAPGLRAPHLLAAERDAEGRLTLWIEDVSPNGRPPLSRDAVLVAARHLGRLSGRWIGRVPDDPWLFDGWIERHSQPQAMDAGLAVVAAAAGDASVEARLGGRIGEGARLIATQDQVRAMLEGLPVTLCHHDAVAANVFEHGRDGSPETVLIDWESVGPGAIGADLASLLFSSPRRGEFSTQLVPELLEPSLAAYADGIRQTGASVPLDAVRVGLHASIALRWTLVRDVVRALRGPERVFRGSAPNESGDEALEELVALVPILLDSAAEARRLSRG